MSKPTHINYVTLTCPKLQYRKESVRERVLKFGEKCAASTNTSKNETRFLCVNTSQSALKSLSLPMFYAEFTRTGCYNLENCEMLFSAKVKRLRKKQNGNGFSILIALRLLCIACTGVSGVGVVEKKKPIY